MKRHDHHPVVARAPSEQLFTVNVGETTTLAWVHPPQALAEQARGGFQMEFATIGILRPLEPSAVGQRSVCASTPPS